MLQQCSLDSTAFHPGYLLYSIQATCYTLKFRYCTIAEQDYQPEQLLKINNLVSTLFLAETHYDLELLQTQLLKLFDQEADKEAVSLLFNWFKQLVVHGRRAAVDYQALEQVYTEKTEVKQMLETAIAQEREKFFAQGKAQGHAEGKAEGHAEGQAELLIALLEKRFSPLTPDQKAFIYQLESSQLIALSEQLWQAHSLADIVAEWA